MEQMPPDTNNRGALSADSVAVVRVNRTAERILRGGSMLNNGLRAALYHGPAEVRRAFGTREKGMEELMDATRETRDAIDRLLVLLEQNVVSHKVILDPAEGRSLRRNQTLDTKLLSGFSFCRNAIKKLLQENTERDILRVLSAERSRTAVLADRLLEARALMDELLMQLNVSVQTDSYPRCYGSRARPAPSARELATMRQARMRSPKQSARKMPSRRAQAADAKPGKPARASSFPPPSVSVTRERRPRKLSEAERALNRFEAGVNRLTAALFALKKEGGKWGEAATPQAGQWTPAIKKVNSLINDALQAIQDVLPPKQPYLVHSELPSPRISPEPLTARLQSAFTACERGIAILMRREKCEEVLSRLPENELQILGGRLLSIKTMLAEWLSGSPLAAELEAEIHQNTRAVRLVEGEPDSFVTEIRNEQMEDMEVTRTTGNPLDQLLRQLGWTNV